MRQIMGKKVGSWPLFVSEATCPNPTKRLEYSTQNFSGFSVKFLLQYIFL